MRLEHKQATKKDRSPPLDGKRWSMKHGTKVFDRLRSRVQFFSFVYDAAVSRFHAVVPGDG